MDQEITPDTIVANVFCNKCNNCLPPHTVAEHLDISNTIHICPHTKKLTQTNTTISS